MLRLDNLCCSTRPTYSECNEEASYQYFSTRMTTVLHTYRRVLHPHRCLLSSCRMKLMPYFIQFKLYVRACIPFCAHSSNQKSGSPCYSKMPFYIEYTNKLLSCFMKQLFCGVKTRYLPCDPSPSHHLDTSCCNERCPCNVYTEKSFCPVSYSICVAGIPHRLQCGRVVII